ncbi:MAG: hypothetical protein ACJASQ_001528 [Crocinitomicaceae bacterium]|jgi:hypothetical protein
MVKFTTSNIEAFYEIEQLRATLLALAKLNIILCDEDWLRYHRYNIKWSESEELAEIDDGSGNNMFILFTNEGCVIKGFDHESQVSPHAQEEYQVWPGIYDGLPSHFEELLDDEAIEKEDVTFCYWREKNNLTWSKGSASFTNGEDDGSGFLLGTISKTNEQFKNWADDYFEVEMPIEFVTAVYNNEPITEDIIMGINPECDLESVKKELRELES